MSRVHCHCCREYGGLSLDQWRSYEPVELIDAKHRDGAYRWGDPDAPGRWVKLCANCRDELAREGR